MSLAWDARACRWGKWGVTRFVCEQSAGSQAILRRHWPDAILRSDIREVQPHDLEQLDLVSASFPCQGISAAGLGAYLADPRSGLWIVFCGILAACEDPPEWVVVENSPCVFQILVEIFRPMTNAGYVDARWCVCGGDSVMARNQRLRGFIVWRHQYVRRGHLLADFRTEWDCIAADFCGNLTGYEHALHKPKSKNKSVDRCRRLGDAVLVPAARLALVSLFLGEPANHRNNDDLLVTTLGAAWDAADHRLSLKRLIAEDIRACGALPSVLEGVMVGGAMYSVSRHTFIAAPSRGQQGQITLLPTNLSTRDYIRRFVSLAPEVCVRAPLVKRMCATPRHSGWTSALTLTRRSSQDLVTQLFHCTLARPGALKRKRRTRLSVRVAWLEKLMGFPVGHTRS